MGTTELALIPAASGLIGTLVGAATTLLAQRAANAWGHRRWNLEQRMLEYREMLSASAALDWALQTKSTSLAQPEDIPRRAHLLHSAIANRIFTNNGVVNSQVVQLFADLTKGIANNSLAGEQAHACWYEAHAELRRVARLDLGLAGDGGPGAFTDEAPVRR